jgi:hypothetical protein
MSGGVNERLSSVLNGGWRMRKTRLQLDAQLLEPWCEGAAVVGVSLSEYVERALRAFGAPPDAACYPGGRNH